MSEQRAVMRTSTRAFDGSEKIVCLFLRSFALGQRGEVEIAQREVNERVVTTRWALKMDDENVGQLLKSHGLSTAAFMLGTAPRTLLVMKSSDKKQKS